MAHSVWRFWGANRLNAWKLQEVLRAESKLIEPFMGLTDVLVLFLDFY